MNDQPILTEATGKRYKAMQAIGVGGMLVGLIVAIGGGGIYGAVLMALGLAVFAAGRWNAWWHHG